MNSNLVLAAAFLYTLEPINLLLCLGSLSEMRALLRHSTSETTRKRGIGAPWVWVRPNLLMTTLEIAVRLPHLLCPVLPST